jgi:drug/metabolite transporter (DMT)-like permease
LAYAFPTPLSYVLAVVVGLERMSMARSLGVAIAFAGAVGLAASRSTALTGDAAWIGLAMLAPIAIAAGNIYRARFWPEGSTPRDLAFAMSGGGALWLGAVALFDPAAPTRIAPGGYGYLLAAAALASFGNVIYFELQRRGGIVSFSQIGYVGAVLGLIGGTLVLDERYASRTWAAALVVAAGVAVSEFVKRRDAARSTSPEIARKSHR